jgi:NADPH-dependent curcumin reductase CurA
MNKATYVQLVRRPGALAAATDFAVVEGLIPEPEGGQVLVENRFFSVDPYMRARMSDAPSYYSPWPLRAPLSGDAVGVVVQSRATGLPEGQWVASDCGWRDRFVAGAAELRALDPPSDLGYSSYLGVLGATGLTAYLGVVDVLAPQPGEVVFVTTAAGSVGSIAGQLCRSLGASVIGSTSTDAKVEHVITRYRFDTAFNYRRERVSDALRRLAPDGIDGLFDCVGGEQLEAALDAMRIGGRIAKCGEASAYNSPDPPVGPRNLRHFFGKRLLMRGFLVSDHHERIPEFQTRMRDLLSSGQVVADETVVSGLDQAVPAFLALFEGENLGKTLVALP